MTCITIKLRSFFRANLPALACLALATLTATPASAQPSSGRRSAEQEAERPRLRSNDTEDRYAPGSKYEESEPALAAGMMDLRLGIGGQVFFGGEADVERNANDADMLTTLGLFATFEAPVHRYFALGGEFSLNFWNDEEYDDSDVGRSLLFNLLARPKARYPMVLDNGHSLELYAVLPIGLNISVLNGDAQLVFQDAVDSSAGTGFSVGFCAGVAYWVSSSTAVTGEFGMMSHSVSNELERADGSSLDYEFSFVQWGLKLGLQFTL